MTAAICVRLQAAIGRSCDELRRIALFGALAAAGIVGQIAERMQ